MRFAQIFAPPGQTKRKGRRAAGRYRAAGELLEGRPGDPCGGFRSAAGATRASILKKIWQNWRISANSRFFAENSLQIWRPVSAVFWRFRAKTTKKGEKIRSLVELVIDGRARGRRAARGSRAVRRISFSSRRGSRIEGRVPPAADAISPHEKPSLVDLVPGCRVLVPRARRDLPVFRGFRAETRGSRIELHGARYVWRGPRGPGPGMIHWEKDRKKPARIAPGGLDVVRLLSRIRGKPEGRNRRGKTSRPQPSVSSRPASRRRCTASSCSSGPG